MTEYAGHDAVYLERRFTREHVGDLKKWKYYNVKKARYIILNPEAKSQTIYGVTLEEGQTLDSVYMTITSPEGVTQHFGRDDLFEESLPNGGFSYKFAYPDVKVGSMIEEGHVLRRYSYDRPLIQEGYVTLQTEYPVENMIYRYTYPKTWDLETKHLSAETDTNAFQVLAQSWQSKWIKHKAAFNTDPRGESDSALQKKGLIRLSSDTVGGIFKRETLFHKRSNGRVLSVTGKNVPARVDELWSPYHREYVPYLKFMVAKARTSRYYLEQPNTFSQLLKGLRLDRDDIWDMRNDWRLEELTEDIIKDAKTNVEKATAINNWVQQNLKIGECGRRCTYRRVLKNGEGSYQIVMEITIAMLRFAGFDSKMIMIHPATNGYFDKNYITLNEFSAPGVVALKQADTLVLYPQTKNLPVGLLPEAWRERPALYIEVDDRGVLGKSPESKSQENTQEEEYELTIDADGLINVKEVKYFRGLSAFYMRSRLDDTKESELTAFMRNLLSYDEGDVELKDFEIQNRSDNSKQLIITVSYTIDNLVTVTPDEVVFQTGGLFSPSSELKTKVETDDRTNPIRIYSDELIKKRISINYPSEWQLDTDLKPIDFSNVFGELEATYANESGRLFVEQRRLLKQASQPKEQIHELLKITGRESQLYVPTLIFAVNAR